jgi:exonuclease SbcD
MIKLLHTADLHLGKILHEYSLLEDQAAMLDQLSSLLADPSYGALLVAGDVYDRSIPSPEAATLFSSFLEKLRSTRPDLAILILPGNHDSAPRLGFGRELFARLGIHIAASPDRSFEPLMAGPKDQGCAFFLLPFLYPGCLSEAVSPGADPDPVRSQGRLAELAAARLETARIKAVEEGAALTVLGAHLFTLGGREAGSERVFLGTAEQVDAGLFAGFDYTALGHLHRFQQPAARVWYSGSPLAYSFDEADQEKVFLSVTLEPGREPAVEAIPVKPLRRVRRLRGSFNFFFRDSAADPGVTEAAKDYLEISLDDEGLVENPLVLLRPRFPFLLSVRQGSGFARLAAEESGLGPGTEPSAAKRSPVEDFTEFLKDIYGEADADKLVLFEELLLELEAEEDS